MDTPRRRGREAQSSARSAAARLPQQSWGSLRHASAPLALIGPESVERIHQASLTILEEIGMDFLSPQARAIALAAGAQPGDGPERLRFDRALVMAMVAKAPAQFTLRAGDPAKDLPIGQGFTHWGCVSSAPQVNDLDGGRRPGRQADFQRFVKLGQSLNVISFFGGYPVEPQDLPAATRHLDCITDYLTLTDKVFHPYCLGATRIRDALELIKLGRGLREDQLHAGPQCYTVVNSSSPLRYDAPMLDGLIEMARANQCVCFTPFTLAGAMAPITLAGAIAQQNAEALAGIVFAQMVRPGAPVIYGAYTSNVDMRTGAPAMGTPEYFKAAVISGQLARFYGVPYRSSGGNAANAPDAQAVYETMFALWGAKLGQADIVMHSAGWLEGGLSASPEKLIIDAEILQGMNAAFAPVVVDDDSLGLDAIREVGPGGHYFGAAHTMARYTSEFYVPLLSDWSNFGAWTAAGSREALTRAHETMNALLEAYQPPPLDPARAEAMADFVARRKAEGGRWMPEPRAGLRPLFQPLALRGRVIRNRIASTAHAPGYAEGGLPGPRYMAYHEAKARGGIGLTMFGGSSIVSGDVTSMYGQIDVSTDRIIPHFRAFAARIHAHGAALMCQISHMGRRTAWDAGDWIAPIAPSTIRDPAHHAMPREMEEEDITRVLSDYAQAARRCAEGGLDGCEVFVTSHLPGQFLSPAANRREDQWGGSLENRMRFLMEVLRGVRAAVPEDFIVSLRMSPDESSEAGPDAGECLAVARAARDEGLIDLVNLIGPGGATNASIAQVIPGMALPLAPWMQMAKGFRDQIGLPVLHATRITDLGTAAHAVESGAVDLVGMTRGHIADPAIVRKALAGQEDRIRPCVGAAYCIDRVYSGKDATCLHNAATGRETWLPQDVEPAARRLRAVVVGGGPAGMEAARVLALRGHKVTLFEASGQLGGQIRLAEKAAWRRDMAGIADWLAAELGHLGVDIRFNCWAEAETVLAETPDIVIDATGGLPKAKPIPGADLVQSSWEVLTSPPEAGRLVLIHDEVGGHQAVSLAEFLTRRGCTVEICTPDRLVGRELGGSSYPIYLGNLARAGVVMTTAMALVRVERFGNRLSARLAHEYGGPDVRREVDLVVAECGTEPIPGLFHALKPHAANRGVTDLAATLGNRPQPDAGGMRLYRVGDAVASRDIHAALLDSLRLCAGL